ncbi:MAG: SDR family oxidoreductase [Bacteroidales bacterium]
MSFFSLEGKTILVTGASSGIGKQIALSIAECGGRLIISGRNTKRLQETYLALKGTGHIIVTADLAIADDIELLVQQTGEINGLVHCAGKTAHMPAHFIKPKHIADMFKVNFEAPVLLTSRLLGKKKLQKQSSIVFISSVTTQAPFFGGALYVSSKAALEGYSKVLSLEIAPKQMRSNCISPGFIKTGMIQQTAETVSQEVIDKVEKAQMLGAGNPQDVALAVIYFLSDASRWVTGTNLLLGGPIQAKS